MAHVNDKQARKRGVVIVEAAVVFPLLILLTFAMIEYGWMFLNAQQTTNAARHGARVAVRADSTTADVQNAVSMLMNNAGITDAVYSLSVSPADVRLVPPGQTVNVTVTVASQDIRITGMPLPMPVNLQASVSMAKEGP